jgi:hypothetical protein
MLCEKNKRYNKLVHRLVATAFIPNPQSKETVNHIDCNKRNNNVSNLEWATRRENEDHAVKNNLKARLCKLTLSKEKQLVKGYLDKKSITSLADEFSVSVSGCILILKRHKVEIRGMQGHSEETKKHFSLSRKGKSSPNRKLGCETVRRIKEQTMLKRTNKSIAVEFGVGEHVVGCIKKKGCYHDCFITS